MSLPVTHAMSLFDLQDVCMVIGSIATLDLPMVIDLIGIFELKGPYCTLTMTDWFLQELSVIPKGSWGNVARRFTMIRWYLIIIKSGSAALLDLIWFHYTAAQLIRLYVRPAHLN
ncbi:putative LRR receptor-like serine/threonine-protein kinase [Dorcoceras hygrometricum]|uniref:Putative LRR receptor-like serine/threonine-protein kinase n=1 Tax=Dorcoceras hygrometricum TaxID=472368 RepID=A0A2Z7CIJ0_9LAMI|nr:putative LRR receptor-like serine/threonine-protein kinase [Dorcoceras hygrometricum]